MTMQKELRRSATDCKIFGVCGGIGEYFGIDSNLVRLIWAGFSLFAGTGVILYIVAAFIMPKADPGVKDLKDVIQPEKKASARENRKDSAGQPDLKDVIHPKEDKEA